MSSPKSAVIKIEGLNYGVSGREGFPGFLDNLKIHRRGLLFTEKLIKAKLATNLAALDGEVDQKKDSDEGSKSSLIYNFRENLTHVFVDADFNIEEPCIAGITGENGSGKSTLLYLLANIVQPDTGTILINGDPVHEAKGRVILCHPGAKPFGEFTPVENAVNQSMFHELKPSCLEPVVKELLLYLEMKEKDLSKPASSLSDGGKRKSTIVGAIVRLLVSLTLDSRPHIFAIDEPTNALDARAKEKIYALLVALRKRYPDLTVIITTNNERDLKICDIVWNKSPNDVKEANEEHQANKAHDVNEAIDVNKEEPGKLSLVSCGRGQEEKLSSTYAYELPDLGELKKESCRFVFNAFLRRNLKELFVNPLLSFYLLLTLILPNLIPLFSGEGEWTDLVKTIIGIFLSCITRDAYRLIERERGYFGITYLSLLNSKLSLFSHFRKATISGLITNGTYSLLAGIVMAVLFGIRIDYPTFQGLNTNGVQAFVFSLPAIIFFAYGVGNLVAMFPFVMRDTNHFFFLSLVPMATFIISGWYYPPEKMFIGLAQLAQLNPLTYLSKLLDHTGDSQVQWGLVWNIWVLSICTFVISLAVLRFAYDLVKKGKKFPVK